MAAGNEKSSEMKKWEINPVVGSLFLLSAFGLGFLLGAICVEKSTREK